MNDGTQIDDGNLFQNRPPDGGCVTTYEVAVKKNLFHGRETTNLSLENQRAQNRSDAGLSLVWVAHDRLYRDLGNVHVSGEKSLGQNPRRVCGVDEDGAEDREDGIGGDQAMDSVSFCVLTAVVPMGSRLFGAPSRLPTDGNPDDLLKTARNDENLCSFHFLTDQENERSVYL